MKTARYCPLRMGNATCRMYRDMEPAEWMLPQSCNIN